MDEKREALAEAVAALRAEGPGIRWIERPGWLQVINSRGKTVYQNSVFVSEYPPDAGDESIDRSIESTIAEYRDLGLNFRWIVRPWTRPADLGRRLLEKGLTLGRIAYGMTRSSDLAPVNTDSRIRIERMSASNLDLWVRTYGKAWGIPNEGLPSEHASALNVLKDPQRSNSLAFYADEPAGVASSAILERSAYFSNSAVLPEFRKKGIFRELIYNHCRLAGETDRSLVTLYAFKDTSFPILERMGFDVIFESPQYFFEV